MNIAFFHDIPILGGGELWALNMARALTAQQHQVSIICPHRSRLFHAAVEAKIDVFGYDKQTGMPMRDPILHFLKSREVDVVYCTVIGHFCESHELEAIVQRLNHETKRGSILINKTGLPPMSGLSGEYYGFGASSAVRGLHVVSQQNKDAFVAWQGSGDGAEEFVQVVREGVDLSRFAVDEQRRKDARLRWGVEPDDVLVLTTSRFYPTKGHDNLLLAAQEASRRNGRLRFILAGEGREMVRIDRLRKQLGLESKVDFAGHVDDISSLLAAADVLCHPSLADGMPNSVVEAMASGLPVLASAVGGIPEIVKHEQNGLLVKPHDIDGLTEGLVRLADSPELRRKLGAAAAEDVRREMDFSSCSARWQRMVAEELEAYRANPDTVVAPPSAARAPSYPVLFLMTHLRTGGEETEVALLARHLDRERFPLSVASAWPVQEPCPSAKELEARGIVVDQACHGMATIEKKADYIASLVRKNDIRLLVACQTTGLAYLVMKRLEGHPCQLIEHAGIPEEVSQIPKDRTAALIGVSAAIGRAAEGLFADRSKVHVLPSMVDVESFQSEDRAMLRGAYGFGEDVTVLFVGRLDAKKGINVLIDAAKPLLNDFQRLRFLVVGPPDAFQAAHAQSLLDRAARELPEGRFLFTGARDDVPKLMRAADILALPSIGEGMSHVINEAGAAGLPVISFDDGAASEQLSGGSAGVLVPPGDTETFGKGLRLLIENESLRERLGAALCERVRRCYDAPKVVRQWEALFGELCAEVPAVRTAPALRALPDERNLPFPIEIQVETNTSCNATCIMCPYPEVSKELPAGRMAPELYEKILAECEGEPLVHRIEPFLNNEPFTDTRMVDWITLAKKRVPHAAVTVTTNGSLLLPKVTDRLVKSGIDAVWISFNGATKETYEKIMGLSFDRVKANIDYLLDVKPDSLRVFTNMIDTEPMKGEILENIRYWESRGVQSGASPLVNRAGNVQNFDELNYKTLSAQPARLCDLLYHKMYIGYNGDVLLCCMDWRRRVVLGNVREQSLRDVWLGEKYQKYRRLQEEGRSAELELCADCSYTHS